VLGAAPRRPCASSSCLRVHEPSSNRRPRPSRKSRKPKRGPTTPHGCTRGGWRACLPRTQREQRMQGAGRTGGAAVHAPGALTPSALASWPTPGAGAGPGEAGQPSWPHRRGSRASAAEWKRRGWPTRRRTMGGRCARRPSARRPVRMPRDCNLSGATQPSGTGLALEQESGGHQPGVAGQAQTYRGVGDAHRHRLAGLPEHAAPGPSVPPHA